MKAAFVINRSPAYRLYSPIIDAALARGWEVECWHDYQAQTGAKGYNRRPTRCLPSGMARLS